MGYICHLLCSNRENFLMSSRADALAAIKTLTSVELDGHVLEMKMSNRVSAPESGKGKGKVRPAFPPLPPPPRTQTHLHPLSNNLTSCPHSCAHRRGQRSKRAARSSSCAISLSKPPSAMCRVSSLRLARSAVSGCPQSPTGLIEGEFLADLLSSLSDSISYFFFNSCCGLTILDLRLWTS